MIERRSFGPHAPEYVQVFVGACVAVVVREVVAVAALLGVAAARDEMHGEPAAAQLIECRDLARGKRGCDEAGTMGQHEVHALRYARSVGDREERVGAQSS